MSRTALLVGAVAAVVIATVAWRRSQKPDSQANGGKGATATLRAMALAATPEKSGIIVPQTGQGMWGLVADLGLPNGGATVVAFVDGSASIYWGESGGVIGGESHESVRQAAQTAVHQFEGCAGLLKASGIHELPKPGNVRLYAHARTGLLSSDEVSLKAVSAAGHPLSGCFAGVNDVITALRRVSSPGA